MSKFVVQLSGLTALSFSAGKLAYLLVSTMATEPSNHRRGWEPLSTVPPAIHVPLHPEGSVGELAANLLKRMKGCLYDLEHCSRSWWLGDGGFAQVSSTLGSDVDEVKLVKATFKPFGEGIAPEGGPPKKRQKFSSLLVPGLGACRTTDIPRLPTGCSLEVHVTRRCSYLVGVLPPGARYHHLRCADAEVFPFPGYERCALKHVMGFFAKWEAKQRSLKHCVIDLERREAAYKRAARLKARRLAATAPEALHGPGAIPATSC